jgi:nucleoside-diphosphate-sugar epimerase
VPDRDPAPAAGERVVLVTGATGMVGPRVVERFAAAGFRVRVLTKTAKPRLFGPEIDVRIGDVTDAAATRAAVEGIDAIVHMAALLHAPEGARPDGEVYRHTNVEGTRHMVNAAIDADVRRFVLYSTIAVYGPGRGDLWNESSSLRPDTPYGVTKAEAERIVLDATRRDGTPLGVVLRLAAVFGPNLKGNYLRLVRALAAGRFVPLGAGTNRRALINDCDVAAATLLAATHPAAAGRTYNLSDGIDYPLADVIGAMCHALGRRAPRVHLPLLPVRWGAGVLEAIARVAGVRPPVTRAAIEKYTEDTRVDSSLIRKELGFVPQSSLREGWVDAIGAMRQSGQV